MTQPCAFQGCMFRASAEARIEERIYVGAGSPDPLKEAEHERVERAHGLVFHADLALLKAGLEST